MGMKPIELEKGDKLTIFRNGKEVGLWVCPYPKVILSPIINASLFGKYKIIQWDVVKNGTGKEVI